MADEEILEDQTNEELGSTLVSEKSVQFKDETTDFVMQQEVVVDTENVETLFLDAEEGEDNESFNEEATDKTQEELQDDTDEGTIKDTQEEDTASGVEDMNEEDGVICVDEEEKKEKIEETDSHVGVEILSVIQDEQTEEHEQVEEGEEGKDTKQVEVSEQVEESEQVEKTEQVGDTEQDEETDQHEGVEPPDLQYEAGKRYSGEQRRISGDFGQRHHSEIFTERHLSFMSMYSSEGEGIEEESLESEASQESSVLSLIDRREYIMLYASLMSDYPAIKVKNNYLQRKMADYFKRRKMEHVLRESDRIEDLNEKYLKKLDDFSELRDLNNVKRNDITSDINEMKAIRDKQVNTVSTVFTAMQHREREIGVGLIYTKTAKEIPEKLVERLLRNQSLKTNEVHKMRLRFIKLTNNIHEITEAIHALDKIGEKYTLIDYEQMKVENQSHADKIEERDGELSRLRVKSESATQLLAHLREKTAFTEIALLEVNDELDELEMEKNVCRERLQAVKCERDNLRSHHMKLKKSSGLLTKTKLLIDMQNTIKQIEELKKENKENEIFYLKNATLLIALKRTIAHEEDNPYKFISKTNRTKKAFKGSSKFVQPSKQKFNF